MPYNITYLCKRCTYMQKMHAHTHTHTHTHTHKQHRLIGVMDNVA